jgi:hypothetical protein
MVDGPYYHWPGDRNYCPFPLICRSKLRICTVVRTEYVLVCYVQGAKCPDLRFGHRLLQHGLLAAALQVSEMGADLGQKNQTPGVSRHVWILSGCACAGSYSRWKWNGTFVEDRTTQNELSGLWTSRRFLDLLMRWHLTPMVRPNLVPENFVIFLKIPYHIESLTHT